MRPKAIVFDVNGTLLDMEGVKQAVNQLLKSDKGYQLWFSLLLQHSIADTVVDQFHDFADIAEAALEMAAHMMEQEEPAKGEKQQIVELMKTMPAFPEVPIALERLRQHDYKLLTLSNSGTESLTAALQFAGLSEFFDLTLSVSQIKKYKPAKETYWWAAEQIGVEPKEMLMVAAHGWDIAGAIMSGLKTAFISRPGQTLYPLSPNPTYICPNLERLADRLSEKM